MNGIRVLLLEDDERLREIIRRLLVASYRAKIVEATSNREALQALSQHDVDLIVTDLIHSGPSGIELLHDLAADARLSRIPVLVQSGNARKVAYDVWKASATGILAKPFSVSEFIESVDAALAIERAPDLALLDVGTETPGFDYKGIVRLDTRDQRAAFAKDVIAFANYGGGHVVVGVDEIAPGQFVWTGLTEDQASSLEATKLNKAVRRFLDPPVHVATRRVERDGRTFVLCEIPAATDTLILAAVENEAANLRRGRIYCRSTSAESCEIDSSEALRAVLARVADMRGVDGV